MSRQVRIWARWFPELMRFHAPEEALSGMVKHQTPLFVVIYLVTFAVYFGVYFTWLDDHIPRVIRPVLFALGSVICGVLGYALLRKRLRRGLRRELRAEGVMLCIPCGYDLQGNQSGVCPECGKAVEVTV